MTKRQAKKTKIEDEKLSAWFAHDLYLPQRIVYFGSTGEDEEDNSVNPAATERVIKALLALELEAPGVPITMIMNSPGGYLYQAMAIYDTIRMITSPITIKAFGECMSAASLIMQAADIRMLAPNTTFMIHDGTDGYEGHARDFELWAVESKRVRKLMYAIYESRSGKPAKFWEKTCARDLIITAQQAVDLGLADSVMAYPTKP